MTHFVPKLVGTGERAPASKDAGAGAVSADSSPLPGGAPTLSAAPSGVVSTSPAPVPAPVSIPSAAEAGAHEASPRGNERSDPFRQSLLLATGNLPLPPSAASRKPPPRRQRLSRGDYLAAALLVAALAIAGFSFGRWRASNDSARMPAAEASSTQQSKSGLRPPAPTGEAEVPTATPSARELPLIPFVPLEVEPEHAQIWLDHQLVGTGRVQLGAIQDGVLHELRFVAPGHETKTLFFRDEPPAGRVRLKRVDETASVAAKAGQAGTQTAAPQKSLTDARQPASKSVEADAPKKSAQRPPAPARPAPRARPAPEAPAPAAEPPAPKPPHVQLIEVHTPRVQVLD
jgi:hypothetical protein